MEQEMKFDKEEYRKRRKNTVPVLDSDGKPLKDKKTGEPITEPKPLRGQTEDRSQPRLIRPAETVTMMSPRGWVNRNRAERRKKIVDRTHTKSIKGERKGPGPSYLEKIDKAIKAGVPIKSLGRRHGIRDKKNG